jgi:hypothetical protein
LREYEASQGAAQRKGKTPDDGRIRAGSERIGFSSIGIKVAVKSSRTVRRAICGLELGD